jgi:hypothetical protein
LWPATMRHTVPRVVAKAHHRIRSRSAGLRAAVGCLPRETREGLLAALDEETLLTGAYSSRDGGLCPMAAAHRRGPRGDAHAFVRAWDRFCGVKPGEGRRATQHELATLRAHVVASLLDEEPGALGEAISEHQALARERRAREASHTGSDWLRGTPAPPLGRELAFAR